MGFFEHIKDKLEDMGGRLKSLKNKVEDEANDLKGCLDTEWAFLKGSENKLMTFMAGGQPMESMPGKLEYGPILYVLNNLNELLPEFDFVLDDLEKFLRLMGMPATSVTKVIIEGWINTLENEGGVITDDSAIMAGNGTPKYLHTYVQLDPGWALSAIEYFQNKIQKCFGKFGTDPASITFDGTATNGKKTMTVAILGDWGTGYFRDGKKGTKLLSPPELALNKAMELNPDITIHLGDVYYAGTDKGFLGIWPGEEKEKLVDLWKAGTSGKTFTLNSNHEMYDGAQGYFDVALASDLFKDQQNTSYFSITFGDWLLLGCDSAFYDPSSLYMNGALFDPDDKTLPEGAQKQLEFIQQASKSGKHLMVMTHHTGFKEVDGRETNLLWDQMTGARALNKKPEYWYWGHVHNGIVYNANSAAGNATMCRCSGHAAVPFGNGYALEDEMNKPDTTLDYYAHTPLAPDDIEIPVKKKRVLNGFTMLTFTIDEATGASSIKEDFWEVSNTASQTKIVWTKTTDFN